MKFFSISDIPRYYATETKQYYQMREGGAYLVEPYDEEW